MNLIIMILLIIFSSCQAPQIDPQERCTISLAFNKCRCHLFDLMKAKRIGESYDKHIEHCEDLTGFKPYSWAVEITPWAQESIKYYQEVCKPKDKDVEYNYRY